MDYLFGEYIKKKKINITDDNDLNDNIIDDQNDNTIRFKTILLYIIKILILIFISWSIIPILIYSDIINVIYQILYILGYLILLHYIRNNYIYPECPECPECPESLWKMYIGCICICICSLILTIISIILYNVGYFIVPYSYFLNQRILMSIIMFFDYFYSYFIIFMLLKIFYEESNKIINYIQLNKTEIITNIFNDSHNNVIIIGILISKTQSYINKNINRINYIYVLFKLIGSLCLCVIIIQICNSNYNYINIVDLLIILLIELYYWKLYYKIYELNNSIINIIKSPITLSKWDTSSWLFLNTIAENKLNTFSFLGYNLSDSSIIQQTIIMVFGWIIAQKIIDILHI
jgi:hypothetical protein